MATNKPLSKNTQSKPRYKKSQAIQKEILREWRGFDEAVDLNAGIHPAKSLVSAVLRGIGAEEGLHEEQVRAAWKELAGEFVAKHTEPVSIKGGNLVLRVTQPALRFQLEQMKQKLLANIQAKLGKSKVRSVKFTLG